MAPRISNLVEAQNLSFIALTSRYWIKVCLRLTDWYSTFNPGVKNITNERYFSIRKPVDRGWFTYTGDSIIRI